MEQWQCLPGRDTAWRCFPPGAAAPAEPPAVEPEPTTPPMVGDDHDVEAVKPTADITTEHAESSATAVAAQEAAKPVSPVQVGQETADTVTTGGELGEPTTVTAAPAARQESTTNPEPGTAVASPQPQDPGDSVNSPADDTLSLLAYPDWIYVVQMVAARQQRTIDRLLERYADSGHEFFVVADPASDLTLLFMGVYPDRDRAQLAVDAMAPPMQTPPWIRRLGTVQKELKAN